MAIINHYIEGATVKLQARFSVNGSLEDPTTITLKVKSPDGVTVIYTFAGGQITRVSQGIYTMNVIASQAKLWIYRWIGTGTVPAVGEHKFDVIASQID